jgi:hypothetical protein
MSEISHNAVPPPERQVSFQINSIAVLAVCSDGAVRQVKLTEKQVGKVRGYINHIQGGRFILGAVPLEMKR